MGTVYICKIYSQSFIINLTWVLLLHLNVLLKDPIYHHLYITHRPSTGIIVTVLMFVMKAAKFLDVLQLHLLLCIPCMYFIVIFLQL